MGKLILLLGGARSGKSSYAQRYAIRHGGKVVYIATARALDHEMETRIAIHRQERPMDWLTLEVPQRVANAVTELPSAPDLVLVDCLTMLTTNLLLQASPDPDNPDERAAEASVQAEVEAMINAAKGGNADWVIVTNEVGLGLVPPNPLGRVYRDVLGRANQLIAAVADEVYWMAAGIPVPIHSYRE